MNVQRLLLVGALLALTMIPAAAQPSRRGGVPYNSGYRGGFQAYQNGFGCGVARNYTYGRNNFGYNTLSYNNFGYNPGVTVGVGVGNGFLSYSTQNYNRPIYSYPNRSAFGYSSQPVYSYPNQPIYYGSPTTIVTPQSYIVPAGYIVPNR